MKKKRYIEQFDFNGNWNGYYGYSYGDYFTSVKFEWVGLEIRNCWYCKLGYYIR